MAADVTRRDLLKGTVASTLAAASADGFLVEKTARAAKSLTGQSMPMRPLGKTGEKVSILCLGGHHLAMRIDEARAIRIIHKAMDLGINFIDTGRFYEDGKSEERIGKALQGGKRQNVFLMTKVHSRRAKRARQDLEESLRVLKTDHIDLWQFHSIKTTEEVDTVFGPGGAFEVAMQAKKEGKVRYLGLTGHTDPKAQAYALDQFGEHLDTMQMPLNCVDPHDKSFVRMVLPKMIEKKVGVLAMKTMAAGHIPSRKIASAADCLRYAWSLPTSSVVSGMDSEELVEVNVQLAKNYIPMSDKEMKSLVGSTAGINDPSVENYKYK